MATTIQLQETTKQLLDSLKAKEKIESYDIVIQHLLKSHIKISDMFGFTKKNPLKFSKKDEMQFNEL
mgnify:FL=1